MADGFAIRGTDDLSRLGGPASQGCVRQHPSHAAALFAPVERKRAAPCPDRDFE
jgi:lipoprotein-anchoring transpeptidase ErfK/SrfK